MPDFDDTMLNDPHSATAREAAAEQAGPIPVNTVPNDTTPEPALDDTAPLIGSFLDNALDVMERRALHQEQPVSLPWPSITAALQGGLWPGLHILVGNTGSGKSQFALQLALHAACHKTPVLYVGLELGKTDLVARLLGLLSGKRWSRLWLGKEHAEIAWVRRQFADKLRNLPFRLEFGPPCGWPYDRLEKATRQMKEAHGHPPLVVLDYLQLVQSPEGQPPRDLRERIGRAAYDGRSAAREHDATVLLVSSTARDNYRKLNGQKPLGKSGVELRSAAPAWSEPPHLLVGAGKESGEVEFAADTVMVLVRGDFTDSATEMHLALAKVRAGQTAWRKLSFNGGSFTEPELKPTQASPKPVTLNDLRTK